MKYNLKAGFDWKIPESRKHFEALEKGFGRLAAGGYYHTCNQDKLIVQTLLNGYPPTPNMNSCSTKIRRSAQEAFADYMIHFRREMRRLGYIFYTFTIIDGRHYTGASRTFIDLTSQQASARNLIGKIPNAGFTAVSEIQMMTNKDHIIDGENFGKVVCLHTHGDFWTKDPVPFRKLSDKLSWSLPPLLGGLKPVKIEPWIDTQRSTYHWSCYKLKSPIDLKRYWRMKEREDLIRDTPRIERKNSEEIRSESAKLHKFRRHMRRLAEIESRLPLDRLMFAGGSGVPVRSQTVTALKAKIKGYRSIPIADVEDTVPVDCFDPAKIADVWTRERVDRRATYFEPPTIIL